VSPPGIAFSDLPPIDAVLVSHNHYDHLDLPTLRRIAGAHEPLAVTPLGNDTIIRRGAPALKVRAADWGDEVEIGQQARVTLTPAHHWSARWIKDRRMALWSGFVIETPAGAIYYAGDTGFGGGRHYEWVRARFPNLRFAILPIGAYEPRWFMAPQHQDPAQAVEGFLMLGAGFAGGMHWGCWQLTNEAVDAPRKELFAALDAEGVAREKFRPLHPGEVWDVPEA